MAAVTAYTTTQAIRASLGMDDADCPDAMMTDSRLDLELRVDLDSWLPTHATLYADGEAGGATAAEQALKDYLLLYAQWFCAHEMAERFLLAPQIVSDGKSQINRFPRIELEQVADRASSRRAKYRALLDEAVNGAEPSTAQTSSLLVVSTPTYDPVTNI